MNRLKRKTDVGRNNNQTNCSTVYPYFLTSKKIIFKQLQSHKYSNLMKGP